MVKSKITYQSSLAVKNLEEVQGQKKPVPSRPRRGKAKKAESSQKQSQRKCGRCGFNHPKPEHCLAKDKKFLKCQKVGHFAAVCRSRLVSEEQRDDGVVAKGSGVDHWFLGALSSDLLEDNMWRVQIKVSRKPVLYKIDTGADITAMSKSIFDILPNQPKLHPPRIAFLSPGGELQCAGQSTTTVTCCNKNYEVDIFVIRKNAVLSFPLVLPIAGYHTRTQRENRKNLAGIPFSHVSIDYFVTSLCGEFLRVCLLVVALISSITAVIRSENYANQYLET